MDKMINLHYEDAKEKTNVDLRLYHYGYEHCSPGHSWGPGIKDHYKIHLVFSGRGQYTVGERTYLLSAGQGFLTTPDTVVSYKADEEAPWTYGWFAFNGLNATTYLNRSGLSRENPICVVSEPQEAYETLLRMTKISQLPSKDLRLMAELYNLLGMIVDSNSTSRSIHGLGEGHLDYTHKAMDYIELNYSRRMSIEEMAGSIGISRKYLTKLFSAQFHCSPQQYLLTYRMEKAKKLLLETTLTISEVGYSVGYPDQFAFSKAFKGYSRMSPNAFRKPDKA